MEKLLLIFLGAVLVSCVKKEIPENAPPKEELHFDTVKPLSYFPVFPGSFWKYLKKAGQGSEVIITSTVSNEYQLYQFPTVKAYVPFYDNIPVLGYQRIIPTQAAFVPSTFNTFLSEKIGDVLIERYPKESHYVYNYVSEKMVIASQYLDAENRNVLQVKGSFMWADPSVKMADSAHVTYREYTKNVGMTFYSKVDTLTKDTIYRLRLVEHRIGK
jgi:hypothetical protein